MKKIIFALLFLFPWKAEAGTSLQAISDKIIVIDMEKARSVLEKAKESSQKAMSRDRIQELKKDADEALGASVFCSATIVEE